VFNQLSIHSVIIRIWSGPLRLGHLPELKDLGLLPNYDISLHDLDMAGPTTTTLELTPGLRIGIGEVTGELEYKIDGALHLTARETDGPFEWAEISITLQDPAWLLCRHIHLQLRATAEKDVEIMPALRLISIDQFYDLFPSAALSVGATPVDQGCVFTLSPRQLNDVNRIDLQIFLAGEEHSLTVMDLSVTGTH
jgi:hypothetical protein